MLIPDPPCGPDWSEITDQEERYEALWEWLAKMTVYARDGWQEAKRLDRRVRGLEREVEALKPYTYLHPGVPEERDRCREALEKIRDSWGEMGDNQHSNTAYAIATQALDPEGCAEMAKLPWPPDEQIVADLKAIDRSN